MEYTIEHIGIRDIRIKVKIESVDIEEVHKKVIDELKWLAKTKDELDPYEP